MELPTVIVLMGVTGSGKSNFIRLATGLEGDDGPEVGDDLVSSESTLSIYLFLVADHRNLSRDKIPPAV
jgi:ABC-type proline/glycine betaine transport system ATPase subunit